MRSGDDGGVGRLSSPPRWRTTFVCVGWALLGLIALGVIATFAADKAGLFIAPNATPSLAHDIFIFRRGQEIRRDDIVNIEITEAVAGYAGYPPSRSNWSKIVAGVAGDDVHRVNDEIAVGATTTLRLLSETSGGRPLTPTPDGAVPDGKLFVIGSHPRSFDSRYQEFGFLSTQAVRGVAIVCLDLENRKWRCRQ